NPHGGDSPKMQSQQRARDSGVPAPPGPQLARRRATKFRRTVDTQRTFVNASIGVSPDEVAPKRITKAPRCEPRGFRLTTKGVAYDTVPRRSSRFSDP